MFLFKTKPYKHQGIALERSSHLEVFALLMSMRTGKTKVIIDTGTHLYGNGKIDCVVVVAPNGVHRNWVTTEIPAHCPDEVQPLSAYWVSNGRKADTERWEALFDHNRTGLRYATMNYEAVVHDRPKEELKRLLTSFRCMLVLDESHRIKDHNARRTKVLLGAATYAPYRRIMTGTSITESPLDLYTQFKFLDPEILGFTTFTTFRASVAQTDLTLTRSGHHKLRAWQERTGRNVPSILTAADVRPAGLRPGRDYFETITGWNDLKDIRNRLLPHSIVVRREDCEDMPAIVRQRIEVELAPEQKRVYREMLRDAVAELGSPQELSHLSFDEQIVAMLQGGDKARAANAMVKTLRLQQILGGHIPDEDGKVHAVESNRLKTLLDRLEDIDGKVILWSRFKPELRELEAALVEKYGREAVVAYHGDVRDDARESAKHHFQNDPTCRYFVGNPKSGGTGLPLFAADTMIYYSTEFSAETRWQSEERASVAGKRKVLVLDMVAPGTVDEKVLASLADKKDVADEFFKGVGYE